MRSALRYPRVYLFAAMALPASVLVGMAGWSQPRHAVEFAGLVLAAILASALNAQWPNGSYGTAMRPPFVFEFVAPVAARSAGRHRSGGRGHDAKLPIMPRDLIASLHERERCLRRL